MSETVRERLLEARRRHPNWGPRKLLAWLEAREPKRVAGAEQHLVADRRRKPRAAPSGSGLSP